MTWQKIKALREERAQLLTDIKAILSTAETAKRDLNADEQTKYNELRAKIEAKGKEIERAEFVSDATAESIRHSVVNGSGSNDTEIRALRHDEKCVDYLSARGLGSENKIGFGQFMRAAVTGPRNADEQRALSEGTDNAGGYTVAPFYFAQIIDKLRPATVCMASGAQVVPLTSDKNNFVKITGDPAATWRGENASVAIADNTFGQVQFVPKTLAVIVKASRELLEDSLNVEQAIEMAFVNAFSTELDRVALVGSSGNGEPVGIANFAGVNSISMGTNGAQITNYSNILDAVYQVELNNATVNAIVASPRTLRTINGFADTLGQPLRRPDSLANVPFRSTTGVPINQTQGSANNASTLFTGDFSRLWFGIRTALRVEILKEQYAPNLQYGFLAYLRADVAASHENAFTKLIGIIP